MRPPEGRSTAEAQNIKLIPEARHRRVACLLLVELVLNCLDVGVQFIDQSTSRIIMKNSPRVSNVWGTVLLAVKALV